MTRNVYPFSSLLFFTTCVAVAVQAQFNADVVVLGSTPAAITAAVSAARNGMYVLLLDNAPRPGGMMTGGLGASDIGSEPASSIGGMAHEFFVRVAQTYNKSATTPEYFLEPHVAENVFNDWVEEQQAFLAGVIVAELKKVTTDGNGKILSVTDDKDFVYSGTVFIDGTYEGELLAAANASMTFGRESNETYNESFAGRREPYAAMDFAANVSPYINNQTNTGGLYPFLVTDAYAQPLGSGDDKVQDYNFRLCVTNNKTNMVPFPKPAKYNSSDWDLLRLFASIAPPTLSTYLNNLQPLPNHKFDMNNGGLISTDAAGLSWLYPNASSAQERNAIRQQHVDYQQGFLYVLGNDPAIPQAVRDELNEYGLCADEFTTNNNWPEQLYVREARRLVGDRVMIQQDIQDRTDFNTSSICLGSYAFDGHYSHRGPCIVDGGKCTMWTSSTPPPPGSKVGLGGEGYPGPQTGTYQIPYFVLLPKRAELTNALAVTTPSASHVAFCSLRMEPQYMMLGQAAGVAAALAVNASIAVQDVNVATLHSLLAKQGAILA